MTDEQWHGDERRSIPIHVLTYIDTRLKEHNDVMIGKIDSVQQEVYHLTQSITSWMDKTQPAVLERCEEMIDELVPTHPENPDATKHEKRKEHRVAHSKWIANVNEEMARWRRVREEVIKWAILGGLGVVVIAVWQYILAGPKG